MKEMRTGALACLIAAALVQDAPDAGDVTRELQEAVQRGHEWLLRNQNPDGSWAIDGRGAPDITCTALGALALMGQGNTDRDGPTPRAHDAVRRALNFVLQAAKRSPRNVAGSQHTLIQGKLGTHVHTFFATVFLTQAYGLGGPWLGGTNPDEVKEAVREMASFIASSQDSDGSWHKDTFGSLKATCMAWLALRSAHGAGIAVEQASVDKTLAFIRKAYNNGSGFFDAGDRGHGSGGYQLIYSSSSALRILFGMGEGSTPEAQKAAAALLKELKTGTMASQFLSVEGEDYLSAALLSQAFIHDPGGVWKEWFPFVREALLKRQSREGTWTGTACISGRLFATSCALLCLQVPYRQLPIQEQ
jgi:hypothetical protein